MSELIYASYEITSARSLLWQIHAGDYLSQPRAWRGHQKRGSRASVDLLAHPCNLTCTSTFFQKTPPNVHLDSIQVAFRSIDSEYYLLKPGQQPPQVLPFVNTLVGNSAVFPSFRYPYKPLGNISYSSHCGHSQATRRHNGEERSDH